MNSKFRFLLLSLGMLAAVACSSTPPVTELPDTADANAEMTRVDGELKLAESKQVNVLSPQNFEKASDSLDKARQARDNNSDQRTILHRIAVAQAYLDKANENATVANQIAPDVVKMRQAALDAQAPKYYPKEFTAVDNDLRDATSAVEDHDTSAMEKSRGSLAPRYDDLELSSIKKAHLGPAGDTMDEARKEGAEKLVPETLAWADAKMKEDDALVTNNRHDSAVIEKAANDAAYASNRVLNMVRHAKATTAQSPEEIAKQWEKSQLAIAQKDQALDKVTGEVGSLTSENQQLASQAKLEQEYNFATKQFTKKEAQIYKQGNNLVLRLRGLTFPKDQSVITTSNYPILAKVQKVIQESDPQSVVVQGHTDSTGSRDVNMRLSSDRAKSVESYLVSNNSIKDDIVSSKGFADTQPIASNKTAKGRAQNRRVDIIISSAVDTQQSANDHSQVQQGQDQNANSNQTDSGADNHRKAIVQ